jgi:hypothetical protein
MVRHEFDLLAGALFLSVSVSALLSPRDECASGPCPALLAADTIIWTMMSGLLLSQCIFAWSAAVIEMSVSRASFPRYLQDHWIFFALPAGLFVLALTAMPAALGTRLYIFLNGHPNYPPWLALVVVVTLTCFMVLQWTIYLAYAIDTLGLGVAQISGLSAGSLGFYVQPWKYLERELAKPVDVPYLE